MSYIQHQLFEKYNELNELNNSEYEEKIKEEENVALTNYEINNILNDKTKI